MRPSFILGLFCLSSGWCGPAFNYGEVLQKSLYFYEAQQSGPLPGWNRVAWRGPSALKDGADVGKDLTGGWYDAGDHVKFNFPMAFTVTLLSWGAVEFREGYEKSQQLVYLLRNIKYTTDYLIKCHTAPEEFYAQIGEGDVDHSFWGPAEALDYATPRRSFKITKNKPGSDLAAEVAAALAAASIAFKPTNPDYARKLLTHAVPLYDFADKYRGKYSDAVKDAANYYKSWSGYEDELSWGALWLYRATGEGAYLEKAREHYDNFVKAEGDTIPEYTWTLNWDNKSYGCSILLAGLTREKKYHDAVKRWLAYWGDGYKGRRITYTPGGLAWLDKWGANRYAANTAFGALVYAAGLEDKPALASKYRTFAKRQIDYLLGKNPSHRSMVVGFGSNPPQRPHHRTSHGRYPSTSKDSTASEHVLYGALVGGPWKDDSYYDVRDDYVHNEVACDYNAGFTGAVAALQALYGGMPLRDFPKQSPLKKPEYSLKAIVNTAEAHYTEFKVELIYHSGAPAMPVRDVSFRYYLDLSETLSRGIPVSQVRVIPQYLTADGEISDLKPTGSDNVYYVSIRYPSQPLYPGKKNSHIREANFRLSVPENFPRGSWSNANDWSYQDLEDNSGELVKTDYLPIFVKDKHVAGKLPPGISSHSVGSIDRY